MSDVKNTHHDSSSESVSEASRSNVYIENLPPSVDDDLLRLIFSGYGRIVRSSVRLNMETGESSGIGFVLFSRVPYAQKACATLNNFPIGGETLGVRIATPKRKEDGYGENVQLNVEPLPDWFDSEKLSEAFSRYGKVTSCYVNIEPNGKCSGSGVVVFDRLEDAQAAMSQMNHAVIFEDTTTPLNVTLFNMKPLQERQQVFRGRGRGDVRGRGRGRGRGWGGPPDGAFQNPYAGAQSFGGPPSQFSGRPSQFSGPPSQFGGPPSQFGGPPSQFTGPPSQFSGPPSQFSGPPNQFNGQVQESEMGGYEDAEEFNAPPVAQIAFRGRGVAFRGRGLGRGVRVMRGRGGATRGFGRGGTPAMKQGYRPMPSALAAEGANPCNLYVAHFPAEWGNEDLRKSFSRFGKIRQMRLNVDLTTGESKRCGFVRMSTPEEAQAAIAELHGKEIGDAYMMVKIANARKQQTAQYSPYPQAESWNQQPYNEQMF
eukprot:113946_1